MINFFQEIATLKVNKTGKVISLHKPLLLLCLISEVLQGKTNHFEYKVIEPELKSLLRNYGLKNSKTINPHLPFIHLGSNKKLWSISGPRIIDSDSKPSQRADLKDAFGILSDDFFQFLKSPENAYALVNQLLNAYWPEAYHEDLLRDLGLNVIVKHGEGPQANKTTRSKAFVDQVLDAYERRCAVCNQSIRLGDTLIGIDACHVKPIQHYGEDLITNGVALCKIHHWALDRGAITIQPDYTLIVSKKLNGIKTEDFFFKFDGKEIYTPRHSASALSEPNLTYHGEYIFAK